MEILLVLDCSSAVYEPAVEVLVFELLFDKSNYTMRVSMGFTD